MLPSVLARQLETGICDYLSQTYPMTNPPFRGSMQRQLDSSDFLCHEPYLAVRLPFRTAQGTGTHTFTAIHPQYPPYLHQQKAFDRLTGEDGRSTLVATGTGSGKTECFLYPILEYCYHHRTEKGIKAILIYPMNALASDQARRIAGLIWDSPELRGNVTAGMYVGGRGRNDSRVMSEESIIQDHETLLGSPPDILLTNYKMLDYLLLRPRDTQLWQDNGPETLKYIAVDELHTFDGAQGTDLACLLRRLKHRLGIETGYLCCVGTSATMGSGQNSAGMLKYAENIFGEPFDPDSVITEDRLTPGEFLAGADASFFSIPDGPQTANLERLALQDTPEEYLQAAADAWLPEAALDIRTPQGRIALGSALMRHSFLQSVLLTAGGEWIQAKSLSEELSLTFPELQRHPDPAAAIRSLFALISHARTGSPDHLRPFLFVQVQLWIRELRRLLAKVDPETITYALAQDLNRQQTQQYLPVITCRDCGITGWITMLDPRSSAALPQLEPLYSRFFAGDDSLAMLFPLQGDFQDMIGAHLCPACLHVRPSQESDARCPACKTKMFPIRMPRHVKTVGAEQKRYVCPCCGSQRGMILLGMRTATEISAGLSQLFASRFNDDKKSLAFSDNVQDAAHRAGFFNSRTWGTGLRTAIQTYSDSGGAGQSLSAFQTGFVRFWRERMTPEEYVSHFTPPNLTYRHAYEDMLSDRKLKKGDSTDLLIQDLGHRLQYEILLEFGLSGRYGPSLERCGCSILAFDPNDIVDIATAVRERARNELGLELPDVVCQQMVNGWLTRLRTAGAFDARIYRSFTKNGAKYLLSSSNLSWMPGLRSGRNTPRFLAEPQPGAGGKSFLSNFDLPSSPRYTNWLRSCFPEPDQKHALKAVDSITLADLSGFIREAASAQGLLKIMPSSPDCRVYGLSRDKVRISHHVIGLRCAICGTPVFSAEDNLVFWEGAPCPNAGCSGTLHTDSSTIYDYLGKLYRSGDLTRINAREHTGLLERGDREELEENFKRSADDRAPWDPNVLSCTPTLEMGIDIGDLSTVILCSMPPTQSQFLQRTGRAGRTDGNALTLTVANSRPHDLYFYSEPLDMIAGEVEPPHIYLNASAVLERQFVAFCLDTWVKQGGREKEIPETMEPILSRLKSTLDLSPGQQEQQQDYPRDMFPVNFLTYVSRTLSRQLRTFQLMFVPDLTEDAKQELITFAEGKPGVKRSMRSKILDAFQAEKNQLESVRKNVHALRDQIKDLQAKPKDSSFEAEIRTLEMERDALLRVCQQISSKNTFNFLSDSGLIPNYAFPEPGMILRVVLTRKTEEAQAPEDPGNGGEPAQKLAPSKTKKKPERITCEFSRPAGTAIREFAPNNRFYADGRCLTIDQVDLNLTKPELWRLCPNCSHAERVRPDIPVAACPRCGSVGWADAGQVQTLLPVRTVYSNMSYDQSLISDDSDDRAVRFYNQQLLVDVDEDKDIALAIQMDNADFPFGYEFVNRATLREINFGEKDMFGKKLTVSGVSDVCRGFSICRHCGKVQRMPHKNDQKPPAPQHALACPTRSNPALSKGDDFMQSLFLFREVETEVLRILVPATTLDSTRVKKESFVAAFMLGMKEYFGNVDHLRATVTEVPVPEGEYHKQFLVIYDSVPGGTGYLKQLMRSCEKDGADNVLIHIFQRALEVLENCSCRDDPNKDGCYHCLYAYRQSGQIGNISRSAAIRMLKSILSGTDQIQKIRRINDISVNPLFESELEQMFVEAIHRGVGLDNISDIIRNGKHSYHLKIGTQAWELEPQVPLNAADGVSVPSCPDFVFWPSRGNENKPVAVFTDGFRYHKDSVAADTLKRAAIRRSGRFRVWSLSYMDVKSALEPVDSWYTETLDPMKMPSGKKLYHDTVKRSKAEGLNLPHIGSLDLLLQYLERPDGEQLFQGQARAVSMSLMDVKTLQMKRPPEKWLQTMEDIQEQTRFCGYSFSGKTPCGTWMPGGEGSCLSIYGGAPYEAAKKMYFAVCAILEDEEPVSLSYSEDWNGFWRYDNLLQFNSQYIGVSTAGLKQGGYLSLPPLSSTVAPAPTAALEPGDPWSEILTLLGDDEEETIAFAKAARDAGIPAPSEDDVDYEVTGPRGAVLAAVSLAWPDRKIGFLTEAQSGDRAALEERGWRILDAAHMEDAVRLFGGDPQ